MSLATVMTSFFNQTAPAVGASNPIKYEVGTCIVCPHCFQTIAYAKQNIYPHERIDSSHWESDYELEREKMVCPDDGTPYVVDGKIHTVGGWK